MTTIQEVINYTNIKLVDWYDNTKRDYNVNGEAYCNYKDGLIVINYIEDGVKSEWNHGFYNDEEKDYWFNIWAEEC